MRLSDIAFASKLSRAYSSEPRESVHSATQTYTEVQDEQTDKDPSRFFLDSRITLGSETFTKTTEEHSDKDPFTFYGFAGN